MRFSLITLATLLALTSSASTAAPDPVYHAPERIVPETPLDRIIQRTQSPADRPPATVCSDAVFIRRLYLDVLGILPTPDQVRTFLDDSHLNKRTRLVDQVLAHDAFADYQAMKWADVLRVKAEFPVNLWPNAAQAYYRWIHTAIRDNRPYDQFARDLLLATGSNFRVGQVNFYRAVQSRDPESLARATALVFLGSRAENWPADRRAGLAAFFSRVAYKETGEWKEEIVYHDPARSRLPDAPAAATFPDATPVTLPPDADPRHLLADWLTDSDNPYFAPVAANRIWCWLMGTGIVHEPDDFRPDNPPANPELLQFLARHLVASKYDLRQVYRVILNSRAYQRPACPGAPDNYAVYQPRRLDAEVLIDVLCQITGTSEKYTSAIPEPFTFVPQGSPAVTLPDASITSSFLETFGRPSRDTGLHSERNNRVTVPQRLHLLNSTHVQRKLEQGPRLQQLIRTRRPSREVITQLYLTILNRFPVDSEMQTALAYLKSADTPREAGVDLAWALINSTEFLYRH